MHVNACVYTSSHVAHEYTISPSMHEASVPGVLPILTFIDSEISGTRWHGIYT